MLNLDSVTPIKIGVIDNLFVTGHGKKTLEILNIINKIQPFEIVRYELNSNCSQTNVAKGLNLLKSKNCDIILLTISYKEGEEILIETLKEVSKSTIVISACDNFDESFIFPCQMEEVIAIKGCTKYHQRLDWSDKMHYYIWDLDQGNSIAAAFSVLYFTKMYETYQLNLKEHLPNDNMLTFRKEEIYNEFND